ncbi:MAG TPA: hypothetical protein VH041_07315 [Caldimonas sp.]|jgi:hypothetical protein|nr:hypothetical protein [Caldimonas sp.]HEX4234100.1 hypothetical protein [Caldimonas sp.]
MLLALPGLANAANCYSVYDAQNRLALQSTVSPVDLSTRISDGMRERFPGGFLIIVPDDVDCREFRTGPFTSPRFESGKVEESREQMLTAPLLRGAPAAGSAEQGGGNNLNVRKR